MTIIVVPCAVRSETEFSGIADEVRLVFRLLPDEGQSLSIAEFEQLLFNIRQIACDLGRRVPIACGALTIEPGTELAAALVSELAPFLETEEW